MKGLIWCRIAFVGLMLLTLYWHGWLNATPQAALWALGWAAIPWLPMAAAAVFRLQGLWIYGGIGALFLFCHGVMEAWVTPAHRVLALTEVALCLLYFVGLHLRTQQLRAQKAQRIALSQKLVDETNESH